MFEIYTRVGWADFDDYENFGYRVFGELAGRTSYMRLIGLQVTGRLISPEDADILDELVVASHVPEPRVWPMKLARVVASFGRALPAFLAASTLLDSDIVGARVVGRAAVVLLDLEADLASCRLDRGACFTTFLGKHRKLAGFGVPGRAVDERVPAIRRALVRRGRADRRYWMLAEELWRTAREERGLEVNLASALAAAFLDLEVPLDRIEALTAVILQPALLANAVEGANQAPPELRRLPDEAVRYVGPAPRRSPRAVASEGADGVRER